MAIAGRNPNALYIFQSLVNILSIILIYQSMKFIGINSVLRILVIIIFTVSTSFVYVNVLYATIIAMFFISLLLYVSVNPYLKNKILLKSILIGIVIGCLIYLRPAFLYFPLFLIIFYPILKFLIKKNITHNYLIIVITPILIILPWTIRNKVVFDKWIPLVSAGGGELWGANVEIPNRTVWYSVTDIQKYEEQRTKSFEIQNKLISDFRTQYNLSDREDLNHFLSKQAKINILKHPFRYALLCINRFLIFWFSPPIGSTTLKSISPILFWITLISKYLITILAITGLWQLSKHHFEQFFLIISLVVYLTLLHSAVHAIQRYFLPLIPIAYFALAYLLNVLSEKYKILTIND